MSVLEGTAADYTVRAPAPAHKLIPGTAFIVDGFRFAHPSNGSPQHFLSHAHSDHYTGLAPGWALGPIYCSEVTARLVVHMLGVRPELVQPLPMDTPTTIDGVEVTLVSANHCPGAVQFLFLLPTGERYVHCGDMRYSPELQHNVHLQQFRGATALFLDTTYCNPRFTFPPQDESIKYVVSTIRTGLQSLEGSQQDTRRVFLISTYGIGKERILTAVHRACDCKIYVDEKKLGVMRCLDLPGLDVDTVFTTDPTATSVHVCSWGFLGDTWPYYRPNFVNMEQYRTDQRADELVAFVPTGWMYEMRRSAFPHREKSACRVHLVPYSEHSSYSELREFVRFMRPQEVIPTVGVNGDDSDKRSDSMLKHFRNLVDETASKARFLASMRRASTGGGSGTSQATEAAAAAAVAAVGDADAASCCAPPLRASSRSLDAEDEEAAQQSAAACAAVGPWAATACDLASKGGLDAGARCAADPPAAPDAKVGDLHPQAAGQHCAGPADRPAAAVVCAVLGGAVSQQEAAQLLARAHGSVAAALNTYYDEAAMQAESASVLCPPAALPAHTASCGPVEHQQQQQQEQQQQQQQQQHHDSRAPSASLGGAATPPVPFTSRVVSGGSAAKRKGAGVVAPGSAKRAKSAGNSQRQITAFFGRGQAAAADAIAACSAAAIPAAEQLTASAPPASLELAASEALQRNPRPAAVERSQPPLLAVAAAQAAGGTSPPAGEQALDVAAASSASGRPPAALVRRHGIAAFLAGRAARPVVAPAAAPSSPAQGQGPAQAGHVSTAAPAPSISDLAGVPTAKPVITLPEPPPPSAALTSTTKLPVGKAAHLLAAAQPEPAADAVLLPVGQYKPVAHACWAAGEPTPYLHIARTFQAMDSTTKRLRISDACANMFRSVLALSPGDLLPAAYLMCGRIAPDYEDTQLSVGGSTVSAAVLEATGVTRARLREMYVQLGDLGDVAQACRQTQMTLHRPQQLTVRAVLASLRQLAAEKGPGSAARRQRTVLALLRSCRDCETKYLVRTLVQNLRVGANWRSVIGALARAVTLHREGASVPKARLDAAAAAASEGFHVCPSLDLLVPAMLEHGAQGLAEHCPLTPGVPLKPMLARITEGIPDALKAFQGAAALAEFKYDGIRAQLHLLRDGSVRIFSRNCEDKTEAFPDVVEALRLAAEGGARALVADAELVAIDRERGTLRAFQDLSTRARGQIELHQVQVPVCVFLFDLLYANGEALIRQSLRERRMRLAAALPNLRPGHMELARSMEVPAPSRIAAADGAAGAGIGGTGGEDELEPRVPGATRAESLPRAMASITGLPDGYHEQALLAAEPDAVAPAADGTEEHTRQDRVQEYLLEAFAAGTEGLMLKALDGPASGYQPSRRSESWVKLKRDYCEGLRDSLDLVPIGAWYGNGRKAGWLSPFLLAAWDPVAEEFQSVCRCMSGFTDAFYAEVTARFKAQQLPGPKPYYRTAESPDIWLPPSEVWEIRGADLTLSPVHKAAVGRLHPDRGVSLRFPRCVRVRFDKKPEEASGPDIICDLFRKQTRRKEVAG